jgi:apolipoprotein N-acyltransferase
MTVISFPPYPAPEFAYAFAVPAIFWSYTRPRFKLFAWTLFAAQAVSWFILLSWLHHVTWLGLFLLAPFIGAWVGLWYLAVWWTIPKMNGRPGWLRILTVFGLAAVWVILEWSRTWVLGGFPWLPLAASQWQRSILLQIASYTGQTGVSFILVVFNLGFAAYAHRLMREKQKGLRRRSPEFMAALLVLMFGAFSVGSDIFNQQRVEVARVAVVQPDIPQSVKWDASKTKEILGVLENATLRAAATHPDLIVWPEAVTPLPVKGDADVQAWTERLVKRAGSPLLMGSVAVENANTPNETWSNSVFVVDPAGGLQQDSYAKRHLVPFGEFVPLRPLLGWLEKVVPIGEGDFKAGSGPAPLVLSLRGVPLALGPLICYEDIFPQLGRETALAGSDLITVVTNNGWFGRGGAAYQHAAHSVLRAVEARRPVIRCGNAGWSGWIDEFGNIRATMTNDEGTIYFRGTRTYSITRDIRWVGHNSYYTEHGDWFIVFCTALIALAWVTLLMAKAPSVMAEEPEESAI